GARGAGGTPGPGRPGGRPARAPAVSRAGGGAPVHAPRRPRRRGPSAHAARPRAPPCARAGGRKRPCRAGPARSGRPRRGADRAAPRVPCYESTRPGPAPDRLVILAALPLLARPGAALRSAVSRSVDGGPRAGLMSTVGIHLGTLVHVAAAAIGLSSLLVSSAEAFDVVKYAGAAYLVFIGVRTLMGRTSEEPQALEVETRRRVARGATVQILNPKTALVFFAFLPQFVDPQAGATGLQILVLGLTFAALGLLSDGTYAVAAGALSGRLRSSRRAAAVSRWASGTLLIGLGVTAALAGKRR